jgi:MshEN domain
MTEEDRLAGGSEAAGNSGEVQHESGQSAGPARQPLATLLAEAGVASEEQLRLAVAEGMGRGERLGEVVLRRGWIDQPGLARLLARQWDLAYVDDEVAVPDPSAGALLSAQESERLAVCVIGFVDGVPLVAVAEPAEERFASVRSTVGRECVFAVVSKSTLERLLAQVVSAEAEAQAAQASADAAEAAEDAEAERLLADLDAAATNLATWSERVSRIVELQRQAENERSACREQLTALREQLTSERATVDRLESELARQRELVSAAQVKLADVARFLEAG